MELGPRGKHLLPSSVTAGLCDWEEGKIRNSKIKVKANVRTRAEEMG